jgi:acyl-coenzyme A synthetase/AMP-(fatty) acid ligase
MLPVPPFRIRVADEAGRPVKAGVTGECQILRRGVSPHYWKDTGQNEIEACGDRNGLLTPDGWLRTGDLATRNRFGLIRLVGRMKDVIKSGGYSVYARELEEAIAAHPAVARAAAFGLPHKEKGEAPQPPLNFTRASQQQKSSCSIGAASASHLTKPHAASGLSIPARSRKIIPAKFCAARCGNGSRLLSLDTPAIRLRVFVTFPFLLS